MFNQPLVLGQINLCLSRVYETSYFSTKLGFHVKSVAASTKSCPRLKFVTDSKFQTTKQFCYKILNLKYDKIVKYFIFMK